MNTGIEVKTGFLPLAFFFYMCTPVIEINGQKNKRSWGTNFFELKPGEYKVRIYFRYLMRPDCGANEIKVSIQDGQTKKVSYYMPPLVFAKGVIKEG